MTMRYQADVIKKGFEMAGINEAIFSYIEPEDPFLGLDTDILE